MQPEHAIIETNRFFRNFPSMKFAIEFFFFALFCFVARLFPLRGAQRFGKALGTMAFPLMKWRRTIAFENLQSAFPEKSEAELISIGLGTFQNLGITLAEFLWFPRLTEEKIKRLVKFENLDLVHQKLAQNKGLILMSGHFGNWELLGLALALIVKHPITLIIQPQLNPFVNQEINQLRCLLGNRVVPMKNCMREVFSQLKSGRIVGILADQSGPRDGLYVEFFNRFTSICRGPAFFALQTGAPILIGYMIRQHDLTYQCKIQELQSNDLHGYTDENLEELTRRHVRLLETSIRQYPDHWLWTHRRWKYCWEKETKEIPQETLVEFN